MCRQHLRGRKSLLRQKRFYPRRGRGELGQGVRSAVGRRYLGLGIQFPSQRCRLRASLHGRSAILHCKKFINLFFFTSTDRFCALDLKSEKRSVIRDKGVEVVCPMITEKNTGDQMSTQRAETVPALTQTQQTDNKCTSAKNTVLGLPGPPFFNLFLPLRVSYWQDVHRASCLPSTMPGIGLTLDLTRINTGVQRSLLLVRKPLLPGECYSSQLTGSRTEP